MERKDEKSCPDTQHGKPYKRQEEEFGLSFVGVCHRLEEIDKARDRKREPRRNHNNTYDLQLFFQLFVFFKIVFVLHNDSERCFIDYIIS